MHTSIDSIAEDTVMWHLHANHARCHWARVDPSTNAKSFTGTMWNLKRVHQVSKLQCNASNFANVSLSISFWQTCRFMDLSITFVSKVFANQGFKPEQAM